MICFDKDRDRGIKLFINMEKVIRIEFHNWIISAEHRVWERTFEGEMKFHPYCSECGVLKNVSGDRGRKFSYFVIALSRLRKIRIILILN